MPTKVIPIVAGGALRTPAPAFRGGQLVDTLGRPMRDLRISVTDRCNFRCVYCMPREVFDSGYKFLPHDAILSFEEIARLAGIFRCVYCLRGEFLVPGYKSRPHAAILSFEEIARLAGIFVGLGVKKLR